LPYEDEKAYKDLIKAVFRDLNPEGAIEEDLAMQFVDSFWRRIVFRIRCLRICDFTIPRGLPILWLLDRPKTYSGG